MTVKQFATVDVGEVAPRNFLIYVLSVVVTLQSNARWYSCETVEVNASDNSLGWQYLPLCLLSNDRVNTHHIMAL